ncbi:ribosome maturation factor RimM [Alteribacter natronophilus]|uniref:ribosome maturation factor RimM n=1 Tax=Alteribacter natronophilus TaxID=2583810 RepID=UPI00110D8796|nr:ribosome maturation factor RimM [Alteribacter natronophilus]TMW73192.1 ribosome maturation factor RimM [Alteribacter natronophilus]
MTTEWLNVGKIVNTHGIRGEVRVISRTDFPEERYVPGASLFIKTGEDHRREVKVTAARKHKQFDLLTFEGLENVNDVEQFKGQLLQVPASEKPDLEEGEYLYRDIIGCRVVTAGGEEIGTVAEILSPGANDVWVVKRPGKKDALIPYIEPVVKDVDPLNKRITIELLEGLIDE